MIKPNFVERSENMLKRRSRLVPDTIINFRINRTIISTYWPFAYMSECR